MSARASPPRRAAPRQRGQAAGARHDDLPDLSDLGRIHAEALSAAKQGRGRGPARKRGEGEVSCASFNPLTQPLPLTGERSTTRIALACGMLQAAAEQRILKLSIGVTVIVSLFGVAFGLLSGSLSIVFDGVFAAIDAAMSALALVVSRLVSREADNRRFQFGYWHIEPMVLALNGGTLMLLC